MGSHLHGTVLALCGLVASLALARGASLPPGALLEGPATDHGDTRAPGQGLDGLLGSLLGPDDASSTHAQSTPTLSRAVRAAGSPTYTQDGAGKTYDGMATLCAARGARLCNVAQVCPNGGAHSAPAGGTQDFDDMWVPVVDPTHAGGKQWVQVGRRAGGTCKRLTDFHAANTAGSWMETTVDKPWKRVTACCGGESATPTNGMPGDAVTHIKSLSTLNTYASPSRVADCPFGYTNMGATCHRSVSTYSALSSVASCPSGYTNMGATCHKKLKCSGGWPWEWKCTGGGSLGMGSMTCPSNRFKRGARCYVHCKAGYTNNGETCGRGAHDLGMGSMTCRSTEFRTGARCYTECKPGYTSAGEFCIGQKS